MSKSYPHQRLVFLDLETTGLEPKNDKILEIGIMLVDPLTMQVEGPDYTACVWPEGWSTGAPVAAQLYKHNRFVHDMHMKSGLLEDLRDPLRASLNLSAARVERDVCLFFVEQGIEYGRATIAGFCPHFDLSFLKEHMPTLHGWFDYRIVDVSTIRGLVRRWVGPQVDDYFKAKGETKHRALDDCEEARKELAFYAKHLFDVDGFRKVIEPGETR